VREEGVALGADELDVDERVVQAELILRALQEGLTLSHLYNNPPYILTNPIELDSIASMAYFIH